MIPHNSRIKKSHDLSIAIDKHLAELSIHAQQTRSRRPSLGTRTMDLRSHARWRTAESFPLGKNTVPVGELSNLTKPDRNVKGIHMRKVEIKSSHVHRK